MNKGHIAALRGIGNKQIYLFRNKRHRWETPRQNMYIHGQERTSYSIRCRGVHTHSYYVQIVTLVKDTKWGIIIYVILVPFTTRRFKSHRERDLRELRERQCCI